MVFPNFVPSFTTPTSKNEESLQVQTLISNLKLQPHIEGGYFRETDRASTTIPCPFPSQKFSSVDLAPHRSNLDPELRSLSTAMFYLLTPGSPTSSFHRNRART